jgi:hypothetical protein
MAWSAGAAKRQEWTRRLQRFADSDLTVVAFCDQEEVSTPAFYQWRRRLGVAARSGAVAGRQMSDQTLRPQAFVPVQITQAASVRMRFPNGVELWLPQGDAPLLVTAIAAAGKLAAIGREEESC